MIEHHLDLTTADGEMNTYVTYPDEGGPFPVIFFYMDAPGKREELHVMARRLATVGYYVVLPNLYYRSTREFDLITMPNGETREQMFELMHGLSDRMVASDTETMLAHVDADPNADGTRHRLCRVLHERPVLLRHGGDVPRPGQGCRLGVRRPPVRREVARADGRSGHGASSTSRAPRPTNTRRRR